MDTQMLSTAARKWIMADISDDDYCLCLAMDAPGYSHCGPAHAGNRASGARVRTVYYRGSGVTVSKLTHALTTMRIGVERIFET